MVSSVSRSRFLVADFSGRRTPFRPPWGLEEAEFVERCQRSGACVAACPEKILERGRGGFPVVNFALGACTFCGKCAEVCNDGAYCADAPNGAPWGWKARIGESCLALSRVLCRTCGEHCPAGAIRFTLLPGAAAFPEIDAGRCTGCGACIAPCPNGAVALAL
jgi:ferredoxin-type protein NapF